jgi:YVTN family beta-propeller protein
MIVGRGRLFRCPDEEVARDKRAGEDLMMRTVFISPFRRAAAAAFGAAVLAFGTLSCSREPAPPPGATTTPAATPAATAIPPGPRLYVSDETGGAVVIVDPVGGQVLERITVGKRPRGIRVLRDGTTLLVALSGSPIAGPGVDESKLPPADRSADGIGVVDLKTRKLVRMLPSGQDPESFDLSPDEKTLYVSNEETAEMSVLDFESGTLKTRVKIGDEPEGVTTRPDGREVWVTCEDESQVFAVDTESLKVVARIDTGSRPRSIVFTRDGKTAFVTNENSASVTVVNTATHTPETKAGIVLPKIEGAPMPPRPMGAVLAPNGLEVLVSLGRATSIATITIAGRKLAGTIEGVGGRPWGIDVHPDGTKAYTANGPSGDVSVVDLAAKKVERKIQTGGSPWGIVFRAQ